MLFAFFREELDGPDSWTDGFVGMPTKEIGFASKLWMTVFRLNGYQVSFSAKTLAICTSGSFFNDFQKKVLAL